MEIPHFLNVTSGGFFLFVTHMEKIWSPMPMHELFAGYCCELRPNSQTYSSYCTISFTQLNNVILYIENRSMGPVLIWPKMMVVTSGLLYKTTLYNRLN